MNNLILIGEKEYQKLTAKLDNLETILRNEKTENENEYLTPAEFAVKFGISKVTQWKLRKSGKLPYRTIGKTVLYRLDEIEAVTKQ
jgi:predicted DNA-binding transcriptional regulator AlpA